MRTELLSKEECAACPACAFGYEPTAETAHYFCSAHAQEGNEPYTVTVDPSGARTQLVTLATLPEATS